MSKVKNDGFQQKLDQSGFIKKFSMRHLEITVELEYIYLPYSLTWLNDLRRWQ